MSVAVRAFAAQGTERLAVQGIVHHRDQRPVTVAAGDGHRPLRNAVEEVDGAVERVDDPAEPARAYRAGTLLAQHAVARALLAQEPRDQRLGVAIGVRDRIGLRAL